MKLKKKKKKQAETEKWGVQQTVEKGKKRELKEEREGTKHTDDTRRRDTDAREGVTERDLAPAPIPGMMSALLTL